MARKILITGGAGFIGSNFIHYWLKKYPEDQLINLDKLTYAGCLENLADIENSPNYQFIKGDICDPQIVDQTMTGVDWVVHFAAESHVDRSILNPSNFVMTNVVGTQILLDAAIKYKVKHFHHVSSDEVFGALPLDSKGKFNEKTLYNPRSPYSASKAGSDHLVRSYFYTFGLPITITNCSNNFGPYQFPEKFISLGITNLLENDTPRSKARGLFSSFGGVKSSEALPNRRAKEDKKIPIYGDGLYVRDWLYVEDHCRAIDLVLEKGKIGETYCVGGLTQDISNLEVAKKICQILKKNPEDSFEYVKDRPGHDRRYSLDWSKIKNELGFKPQHNFDTYLEKTVAWYQENKNWWQPLKTKQEAYFKKQYGTK